MKKSMLPSSALILLLSGAFFFSPAARSAEKDGTPARDAVGERSAAAFPLVFRAGAADEGLFGDWGPLMGREAIENWGKSRGLLLRDDAGPVVDDRARFVAPYGSTMVITGLARGEKYRLWLDFVGYRNRSGENIPSRLVISMNGLTVREMVFKDLAGLTGPVPLDIPYQVSQGGRVVVLFREYARNPGFWGLWDAIVTRGLDLPDRIDNPDGTDRPSMPVKSTVIEDKKPAVKKKAPRPGVEKPAEMRKDKPAAPAEKPVRKPKEGELKTDRVPARDKKPSAPPMEKKEDKKESSGEMKKPSDDPAVKEGAKKEADKKESDGPEKIAPETPKDGSIKEEKPGGPIQKDDASRGESPKNPVKNGKEGAGEQGKKERK